MGKSYRMGRLFHSHDGRTVILPVDHGIALGHVDGLQYPSEVLHALVQSGPDAVLLNTGLNRIVTDVFSHVSAPARLLTVDTFFADNDTLLHDRIGWAEEALLEGFDGIKVLFPWDGSTQEHMETTKLTAAFIREADRWQMPVVVEPMFIRAVRPDVGKLSDCVRIAFELGADILKVPYPGNMQVLQQWVESFKVPIVLLGGPKGGNDAEILQTVSKAMHAGVRGVAIGRNVWQRPLPEAQDFLRRLVHTVHPHLKEKEIPSV